MQYQVLTPPPSEVAEPSPVNHVWIYDRSGSMTRLLPQVAADLKEHVGRISDGDTLTLAWFSGEEDYNVVLKGFAVTEKTRSKINEIIDQNISSRGTTCFSEVLTEVSNIASDLAPISEDFSLVFFTDGHPVVSNLKREVEQIFQAIEAFTSRIAASIFVGYGDYYNRDLMLEMAKSANGALVHSEDLGAFFDAMQEFIDGQSGSPRIPFELDTPRSSPLA